MLGFQDGAPSVPKAQSYMDGGGTPHILSRWGELGRRRSICSEGGTPHMIGGTNELGTPHNIERLR